ncbi:15297_t:CDS:1, partial [Gigaspora rosea]
MNDDELQLIYQGIVKQPNSQEKNKTTHRQKLLSMVEKLPDNQLKSAIH